MVGRPVCGASCTLKFPERKPAKNTDIGVQLVSLEYKHHTISFEIALHFRPFRSKTINYEDNALFDCPSTSLFLTNLLFINEAQSLTGGRLKFSF